jgi:hypothetical protein
MTVDFDKLWKGSRTAADNAESVRTLAKVLSLEDGREFISNLELVEAELCIGILDHVSSNPHRPSLKVIRQRNDSGFSGA